MMGPDARDRCQALTDWVALVPSHELLLEPRDCHIDLLDLNRKDGQHLPRKIRHSRVLFVANDGNELADVG